jgi:hypothetical protein
MPVHCMCLRGGFGLDQNAQIGAKIQLKGTGGVAEFETEDSE